jgi:hypothetical protein
MAYGSLPALTMRAAMQRHRANPVCATCHVRMDQIVNLVKIRRGIGCGP